MIYLISDTHFYHTNIVDYCNRPFKDEVEMTQTIVDNWNNLVAPRDIIYHLGDFGFGNIKDLRELLIHLNGNVTLIRGNHDTSLTQLQEMGFCGVCDEITLNYNGFIFVMSHRPCESHIDVEDVINIHGHTHSLEKFNKNYINVSCDAWDFTPVSFEEMILQYKKHNRKPNKK